VYFRTAVVTVAAGALTLTGALVAQAAPASDVPLTGTQLASALIPASSFGAGYRLVAGSAANSGSRLEHPAVKVNMYTYSCQKWLMGDQPNGGYGETAYALDSARKFLGTNGADGADTYVQGVDQFPTATAAASFYQANYAFTVRCETVTITVNGTTSHLTTQSLTRGHVSGDPAFFYVQTMAITNELSGINRQEIVLAGRDVFDILAVSPPANTYLTPNAATLTLIARVKAAG